jgi:hypothetical protein
VSSKKYELRPEYSPELIEGGERGKYAEHYKKGTNIVLLDPDVAKEFPDAAAVNDALRKYLRDKKNSPGKAT